VALHVELRGSGPPLVLLHGFTQTGRLWGGFGERLAESFTLVAVDLPGHGGSGDVRADLTASARLVGESVREAVGAGPHALVGYSLGARVALHVLIQSELPVSQAVVIGVTAGIENEAARTARRRADEAVADDLEASGDLDGFLDSWLHGPLFERLGEDADPAERKRNTPAGLASSLRLCGTGTQQPLWDRLPSLESAVLALAGTDDARFASNAMRVAQLVPHAVASLVPGGGHAVHLAQPDHVARLVRHWLGGAAGEGA
jgi:2-succinyl-6-hydroxy-2,4-cyclohexadiene-1-carboxylate synthase